MDALPDNDRISKLILDHKGRNERIKLLISDLESAQTFVYHWENAVSCNIIVTVSGEVVHINKRLCDILGYTYDEIVGTTFFDYLHKDDVEDTEDVFSQLLLRKIDKLERFVNRYMTKDGVSIVLMWTAFAESNSNYISATATVIQACITDTAMVCYCQNNNKTECYRDHELKANRVNDIMLDALMSRKVVNKKKE